jgi:hypothetical protein
MRRFRPGNSLHVNRNKPLFGDPFIYHQPLLLHQGLAAWDAVPFSYLL